jgi:hypothetical protein
LYHQLGSIFLHKSQTHADNSDLLDAVREAMRLLLCVSLGRG